jgi:glutamate N-acetyltransferase/amino-acid N-acetyltransferase
VSAGDLTREAFQSRWVPAPPHCAPLPPAELPAGFRAGGFAAGVKDGDSRLDVGVLVCDGPAPTSAARFCVSGALAAPVALCQQECDLSAIAAVIANSGNANAATGDEGLAQARLVQQAAAGPLRLLPRQVAVASTGVIGVPFPGERIAGSLARSVAQLDHDAADFAAAIKTTDVIDKHIALAVELPAGETVRLSAQCKGAGMISPHFATMLCFVQTDAAIDAETADLLLGVTVKRSFDRISVDGQLSTNDTVLLMCSGASGVTIEPESANERAFGEALDALLRELALRIVADGEGAKRVGRVYVSGGDQHAVERVARAVANSPLVKAALFGGDPNWGRIAQAVGAALPGSAPLLFDIAIEGIPVCAGGAVIEFDQAALTAAAQRDQVEYAVKLPGTGAETEVFFSDLSYEYVKINAEYTT